MGRFRIIAGAWRGRRFSFPADADVRPTPDRVRETLFNWLQPVIEGAVFLDLYAGSGALGLEALSRGAARAVFVDREQAVLDAIREHLATLDCDRAELVRADALRYVSGCTEQFDVIALDPPFATRPWSRLFETISERELLKPGGRIYFEQHASEAVPGLPAGWQLERDKRAGRVGYYLLTRTQTETP